MLFGEDVLTYFALRTRTTRTIASIGAALLIGLSGSAPSQAQTSYHLRRDAFRQISASRWVRNCPIWRRGSSDVVLMDLQYAPQVLASASYPTMEGIIIDVAKQERVGLFSRFAPMRNSINAGVAQSALVTFDGLHNSGDGYDCIGRALAQAISTSAR